MIADGRSIDQTFHGLGHVAPMNPKRSAPRHLGRYTIASQEADRHVAALRARADTFAEQKAVTVVLGKHRRCTLAEFAAQARVLAEVTR